MVTPLACSFGMVGCQHLQRCADTRSLACLHTLLLAVVFDLTLPKRGGQSGSWALVAHDSELGGLCHASRRNIPLFTGVLRRHLDGDYVYDSSKLHKVSHLSHHDCDSVQRLHVDQQTSAIKVTQKQLLARGQ